MRRQTSRKCARLTTRRVMAGGMLALLTMACSAQPTKEALERARAFIGDWGGTNEYGWRMEARIESVGDDGRATGAMCLKTPGRLIRGSRIDGRARLMGGGAMVAMAVGTSRFTTRVVDADTLIMLEKREVGGKKWKTQTTLKRTEALECADRFAAQAVELDAALAERTRGIVGYWTGQATNGNIMEMAVTKIRRDNDVEGRRCLRDHIHENIRLSEFGVDGMLDATWDAKHMAMFSHAKTGIEGVQHNVYVLKDAGTIEMSATSHVGTGHEKVETLEMTRGVDPEGCIAWIRPADAERKLAATQDG